MDDLNTIDDLFEAATNFVRLNVNNVSKDNLLYFYARYKQATEGVCSTERPSGLFNFEAKSKYDAWKALTSMSKESAMNEYIKRLDELFSDWRSKKNVDKVGSMSNAGGFGFRMSTMSANLDGVVDEELTDNQKTLFDWCKEGNTEQLRLALSKIQDPASILNQTDSNSMTLLMWACDRGHHEIVKILLEFSNTININAQDNDGQTCLHYAVTCEHPEIIKELLKHKIDVNLTDSDGGKAVELTNNQEIINILSQ